MGTKYEIVWKKGNWLNKGKWSLVKMPSTGDKIGYWLGKTFAILVIVLLVLMAAIIISPVVFVFLGFNMVREKRYIAGILCVVGFFYVLFDINNHWITSIFFFGYNNSDGGFTEGFFEIGRVKNVLAYNYIALGIGVGYIVDSIIIKIKGDEIKTTDYSIMQIVIYIIFASLGSLLSQNNSLGNINSIKESNINSELIITKKDSDVQKISENNSSVVVHDKLSLTHSSTKDSIYRLEALKNAETERLKLEEEKRVQNEITERSQKVETSLELFNTLSNYIEPNRRVKLNKFKSNNGRISFVDEYSYNRMKVVYFPTSLPGKESAWEYFYDNDTPLFVRHTLLIKSSNTKKVTQYYLDENSVVKVIINDVEQNLPHIKKQSFDMINRHSEMLLSEIHNLLY